MKNPIFDIENWKEITATLARNKTRTFLTAFGIFWGTAMLAILWGGAQGFQSLLQRNFAGFATNVAILMPGRTSLPYKGYNKGLTWKLTHTDIDNITRRLPEIKCISSVDARWAITATYGERHTSTTLQGLDHYYSRVNAPIIYDGRFINLSDDINGRKVCVLGKRVAKDLFGEGSPIGKNVGIDGIYYHVIGVCGQTSEIQITQRLDESVIVPYSTLCRAYNVGDDIEVAMILYKDGAKPGDAQDEIERIIRTRHPIHPDDKKAITYWDISEQFEMVANLFTGINLLALFVGIGTLLAGIIGVGNIMWVIVKERTQEIGIRRAIGAKPRDIIVQILSESMALTIIAGMAGICFAIIVLGITQILTTTPTWQSDFQLSFNKAVVIMTTFMVLGGLAGTIPATKAMRIKPIEAINDK